MSWVVGIPIVTALNFPRTLAALGIQVSRLWAAVRVQLAAGVIMYALVAATRTAIIGESELLRLPLLIAIGMAGYLGSVHLLDRRIWIDVRRLVAAVRA
jgi:hypothetical protein